jgi:S1-C subfamily serine protease
VDGASDDDDVDLPLGGPLPPDDRLWRHPSELASAGYPTAIHAGPGGGDPGRRRRVGPQRWMPVLLAGTVGALLTTGLLAVTGGFSRGTADLQSVDVTSSTALPISSRVAPAGVAEVAERLGPSLLSLAGTGADGRVSRGSAIAIRPGHVLTAARLVLDSPEVEVVVHGVGRRAMLVGADADTDLAVLAVEGGGLVPASWGAAAVLRPGDPAIAVSSAPTEPGPTVTAGIVSGVARTLAHAGTELRGLLQVDRPVPVEGAGGALLDPAGALVGITLPAPAASAPFGYAVPAEVAKEVVRQLLDRGRVAHAWLGVEGGDRGMNGGAIVERVKPNSPAAAAGLLDDDVVTEIDGVPTPTMGMLLVALRLHQPGETVRLLVLRGNHPVEVRVTLAERDSSPPTPPAKAP